MVVCRLTFQFTAWGWLWDMKDWRCGAVGRILPVTNPPVIVSKSIIHWPGQSGKKLQSVFINNYIENYHNNSLDHINGRSRIQFLYCRGLNLFKLILTKNIHPTLSKVLEYFLDIYTLCFIHPNTSNLVKYHFWNEQSPSITMEEWIINNAQTIV